MASNYQVTASSLAVKEMTQIIQYIQTELAHPLAAQRQRDGFVSAMLSLALNAQKGPKWLVLDDGTILRKILVNQYLMLYRVSGNHITIERVFHSSQNYEKRFRK